MTMHDYKNVAERLHPRTECKKAVLRAAERNEQPCETRRERFIRQLPVAAAGMAACVSLLFAGAFFWQNRGVLAERPAQISEVSETADSAGASVTTTAATVSHTAEAQNETAEPVQTETAAESQTAAAQTVLQAEVREPEVTAVTTSVTSAPSSSTTLDSRIEEFLIAAGRNPEEWVAELDEQVSQIFSSLEAEPDQMTATTTTTAVTRPPHDDAAWEYGLMVIPNWLSKEATAQGLLPIGDASFVAFAESKLGGTEYRVDDSLYLSMWMMSYLYAADEITHEEMLEYVQMIADGGRFSDEFYAYFSSNAVMEKVYVGLRDETGSPQPTFVSRMADAIIELMTRYPEETAAYDLNSPDTLKLVLLHNE